MFLKNFFKELKYLISHYKDYFNSINRFINQVSMFAYHNLINKFKIDIYLKKFAKLSVELNVFCNFF